jgi:hypothetical protein
VRFTTGDAVHTLNAGKRITQIAYHPLQHLRFFGARQVGEKLFDFLQRTHGMIPISRFALAGRNLLYHSLNYPVTQALLDRA